MGNTSSCIIREEGSCKNKCHQGAQIVAMHRLYALESSILGFEQMRWWRSRPHGKVKRYLTYSQPPHNPSKHPARARHSLFLALFFFVALHAWISCCRTAIAGRYGVLCRRCTEEGHRHSGRAQPNHRQLASPRCRPPPASSVIFVCLRLPRKITKSGHDTRIQHGEDLEGLRG